MPSFLRGLRSGAQPDPLSCLAAVPRIQFHCIEVARNREGHNARHYVKKDKAAAAAPKAAAGAGAGAGAAAATETKAETKAGDAVTDGKSS